MMVHIEPYHSSFLDIFRCFSHKKAHIRHTGVFKIACWILLLVLVNLSLDFIVTLWILLLRCWVLLFLFVIGLCRIIVGIYQFSVGSCCLFLSVFRQNLLPYRCFQLELYWVLLVAITDIGASLFAHIEIIGLLHFFRKHIKKAARTALYP